MPLHYRWTEGTFFFVRTVESVSYVEEYQPDGVMHSSPAVSNFFEAWATVPGFVSYRSVEKGESEKLPMDYYRAANWMINVKLNSHHNFYEVTAYGAVIMLQRTA